MLGSQISLRAQGRAVVALRVPWMCWEWEMSQQLSPTLTLMIDVALSPPTAVNTMLINSASRLQYTFKTRHSSLEQLSDRRCSHRWKTIVIVQRKSGTCEILTLALSFMWNQTIFLGKFQFSREVELKQLLSEQEFGEFLISKKPSSNV